MAKALRLGVAYDFRNPSASGMSHQSLYAAIMGQVAWLDGLGLDLVWFTEHHFVEDGYLPSWIPVAAAMAARTKHVRFSCDVCLLPFNHPIRLAEDLAVLDNISGGRVEIGVGMGYAPHEFRGFGLPVSRRVSLTDEGIAVLRRAFTGETAAMVHHAILNQTPAAAHDVNSAVSRGLGIVITKALEKDRSRRYQSAEEMHEDLERVQ